MNRTMKIYLYANTGYDRDTLMEPAREALETATAQTIGYFANNGERIGRTIEEVPEEPYLNIDSDTTLFELGGEFSQFLKKQGLEKTGEHLLLTHGIGGGYSVAALGGAWQNSPVSVATILPNQGFQYFKSLCVHEAYHNFIHAGFFGYASEHKFGYVDPKTGKQTPMINGYLGEGPAAAGDCSNTANRAPYTLELSPCTLDATLTTYRDQGGIV